MKRRLDASLKSLNSFSVEARAGELIILETEDDLRLLASDIHFDASRDLILGGGSNILFTGDVEGKVILNRVTGKKITKETDKTVLLEACGGENWHQLVRWTLDQGLSGIENLSLIPGLVGAAPIQNIGAYGVELADVLDSVEVLDLNTAEIHDFDRNDCEFEYRDSRFKSRDAGRFLLTRIRLRLQCSFEAKLDYAGITRELGAMGVTHPDARQVSDAITRIRQRKLPDPRVNGNAGSFFKNPITDRTFADELKSTFNDLPVYEAGEDRAKLSAAWMIDQCGWKGRSIGGAAVSRQHALVLINENNASGADVLALADAIKASVLERFGIELQAEPRIIG